MNAEEIAINLPYLSNSGNSISNEVGAALQTSLPILKRNYKFSRVIFWGKLIGVKNDIFIAQGFEQGFKLSNKRIFVSDDNGAQWKEIQNPTAEEMDRCSRIPGLFMGDLSHTYKLEESYIPSAESKQKKAEGDETNAEEFPESEENEEEEGAAGGTGKKKRTVSLKEDRRIACFVAAVDHDCLTVPRGAYVKNASHEVIPNRSFEGLNVDQAQQLKNFYHLRPAELLHNKSLLQREQEGLTTQVDFLDSVDLDVPKKQWSLTYNPSYSSVSLRSLLWPGFHCFHVVDSGKYGCVYVGQGEKNVDLNFML